jgi:predicted acyltransferase
LPPSRERETERQPRWEALDDLRGLAVLVMVPVNVAAPFARVPAWFKHAPAEGLTLADFVVPVFLFSLGLSAAFSFGARRTRAGFLRTFLHALVRSGLLFAFGTVGLLMADPGARWEILQMLGATSFLSFFFLLIPPWPRLGSAACLAAAVEVLRPLGLGGLMGNWYASGIAGPWGTFSLSFFAITASALGELLKDAPPRRRLAVLSAAAGVLCAAGLGALPFFPFSKHTLSLSYILFTAGCAAALLCLLVFWREVLRWPLPLLGSLGRNPLLLYMLHAVLGVAVQGLLSPLAGPWSVAAACAGVLALCTAAAVILDGKRLILKL